MAILRPQSKSIVDKTTGLLAIVWDKFFNDVQVGLNFYATQTVTASSAALSIDVSAGGAIKLALSASVTSLTVKNWPPEGTFGRLLLEITNGGAYAMSGWPGTTIWSGGTAPVITSGAGKKDSILLTSSDGGTTFRGYLIGANMS